MYPGCTVEPPQPLGTADFAACSNASSSRHVHMHWIRDGTMSGRSRICRVHRGHSGSKDAHQRNDFAGNTSHRCCRIVIMAMCPSLQAQSPGFSVYQYVSGHAGQHLHHQLSHLARVVAQGCRERLKGLRSSRLPASGGQASARTGTGTVTALAIAAIA